MKEHDAIRIIGDSIFAGETGTIVDLYTHELEKVLDLRAN